MPGTGHKYHSMHTAGGSWPRTALCRSSTQGLAPQQTARHSSRLPCCRRKTCPMVSGSAHSEFSFTLRTVCLLFEVLWRTKQELWVRDVALTKKKTGAQQASRWEQQRSKSESHITGVSFPEHCRQVCLHLLEADQPKARQHETEPDRSPREVSKGCEEIRNHFPYSPNNKKR
jgi:hypothetical protein